MRGFRLDGARSERPGLCRDRGKASTVLFPAEGACELVHTAPIIEGAGEGNASTRRRREIPGLGIDRTGAAKQHERRL